MFGPLAQSEELDGENRFPPPTIKQELLSPITTEANKVFWSGAFSTLVLGTAFRHNLVEDTQREFQEHKPFGKSSGFYDLMGQLIPNVAYAGGQWAYGHFSHDETHSGYRRAMLMAKATAYAGLVTTIVKHIVHEERPNKGDNLSFPSGHSTTAFAFASVVAAEHSLPWGVAAYTLASAVAFSRINDNMHYLHDIVAGATIGTSFGLGLYYLQPHVRAKQDVQYFFVPIEGGASLALRAEF